MTDEQKTDVGENQDPEQLEISKEGAAQLLELWRPVIEAVVDVCAGVSDAEDELEGFCEKLSAHEEWQLLPDILKRVAAGERDEAALTADIDVVDALIVRATLAAIAGPHPGDPSAEPDDADPVDGFLDMVERALEKDAPEGLRERIIEAATGIAKDGEESEEVRAFGRAVQALLQGEEPELDAVPAAHAERLRQMKSCV